jgi:hypothetical protein
MGIETTTAPDHLHIKALTCGIWGGILKEMSKWRESKIELKVKSTLVKHSIVKIVTSVENFYPGKSGLSFTLVTLEEENSGIQSDIILTLALRKV